MGRVDFKRREIQGSGTTLAEHSLNQKIIKREIEGDQKVFGVSKKMARSQRKKMKRDANEIENSGGSGGKENLG